MENRAYAEFCKDKEREREREGEGEGEKARGSCKVLNYNLYV